MVKKRASKNDEWQGMIGERVDNLVRTTEELKKTIEKGFENVEDDFKELRRCVDDKFDKHNLHHLQQDKKYLKYLFILSALVIGSLVSNPENAKFVWSLVKITVGIF